MGFKGLTSLTDIRIITHKDQDTCNGLAFAEFSEVKDVEAAVQRDGMKIRGNIVFICYESKIREGGTKGTKDNRKKMFLKEALETGNVLKRKKKKKSKNADGDADGEASEQGEAAPKAKKKKNKKNATETDTNAENAEETPEASEQVEA